MQFQLQIFWFSLTKMHHVRRFKVSSIVVPWFHLRCNIWRSPLQRSQVSMVSSSLPPPPDLLNSCLPPALLLQRRPKWNIAGCWQNVLVLTQCSCLSSYSTQYILYVPRLGHWLWCIIILLFCGLRSVMGWLVLGYTAMNWGCTGYKVSVQ